MLSLHHPGRWSIAGVLLLFAVLVAAMVPAIFPWSGQTQPGWIYISDKWLHGMTFAFLTVWYSGQFARRRYLWIGAGLVGFGGLIEYCQSLVAYRTAETGDLVADMLGIVAGLLLAVGGLGGWSQRAEHWLQSRRG